MDDAYKVPAGYRLQPISEFDVMNFMVEENQNLASLVRLLSYSLNRRDPGNQTAQRAVEYLKQIGEAGNLLRTNAEPHGSPVSINDLARLLSEMADTLGKPDVAVLDVMLSVNALYVIRGVMDRICSEKFHEEQSVSAT